METTFKEMAAIAEAEGSAVEVEFTWFEFKKKGDTALGMILAVNPKEGKKFDGTFNVYQMLTDTGYIEFKLGAAADKGKGLMLEPGKVFSITFMGDEEVGKGSKMHTYRIMEIPLPEGMH